MSSSNLELSYIVDDGSEYFRHVHGRALNVMNHVYLLPADKDEKKASP
jgi:hypothetical protein